MGTETIGRVLTEATLQNLYDVFDAENGTESNIGVVNITTGKVIILAEKGINIQPDMQKDYSELEDVLPDQ